MNANRHQLFHLLREVEMPSAMLDTEGIIQESIESIPAVFAIHWPDGSPCTLAEMYLLDVSDSVTVRSVDGGSLRVLASSLSHLIRYCWLRKIDFHELNDHSFHEFVSTLCTRDEKHGLRSRNTIRRIVDTCIAFLNWIQTHVRTDLAIVGTYEQHPSIRLVKKVRQDPYGTKRVRLHYAFEVADDPVDPKRPMPRQIRNRLWDAVATLSNSDFEGGSPLAKGYMRARRELILSLIEAIGCRPAELTGLTVTSNINCTLTKFINIETLKRRRFSHERSVPIDFGTALRLESFIESDRKALLRKAENAGLSPKPRDRLILSALTGDPVEAPTIEKDFYRIVKFAQIEQRACMSMFRHRFITNMVKLHIESFLLDNCERESIRLSEADYRMILTRVAAYTGHARVESLLHYVDWAWDEMTSFDYVNVARELVQAVETSYANLSSLAHQVSESENFKVRPSEAIGRTRIELLRLKEEFASLIKKASISSGTRQRAQ